MNIEEMFPDEFTDVDDDQIIDDEPKEKPSPEESKEDKIDPLFEYLKEKSLIEVDDDFNYEDEDALEKALELTAAKREEKAVNSVMEALPEEFRSILEYGLNGGRSLQDYFASYGPIDLENIDIEDEANQERVLKAYWKETSNFSDDKINRLIDKLKSTDSLEEEAKETVEEWKALREEKKKEFVNRQKENHRKDLEESQKRASLLSQSFEAYEAPKERKAKIQTLFTQGQKDLKFNEVLSQATSNYEHLVQLADFLADYDPKKGFDFNRYEKKAESARTKGLKDILESKVNQKPATKGIPSKIEEEFDFEKFITL